MPRPTPPPPIALLSPSGNGSRFRYEFPPLGAGPGLWAVHIPLVQERLGINPAVLGLGLLVMAAGAVIAMPIMGWAVGHVGSRIPTGRRHGPLYGDDSAADPRRHSCTLFFVALFFFGLLMGGLTWSATSRWRRSRRSGG